ncbi:MAG: ATP-dependent 6-phosphofructokinase [Oscillibacter sp.]|nr:ATP-dependent 6-phosphofructokinase [Oscillibacter sp.]
MSETKRIRRIGVLTSGGDAPGMNAAVRAVVRAALTRGIQCVGIRRGYDGLIKSDFVMMHGQEVSHILTRGGTVLYTARSSDFMTEEGRKHAVRTCNLLGIDALVTIGGDGTFRGALELSRLGVPVVGIPATIDNDVGCSNYTIGFDSACNTAIQCIDKLRDTMSSHERTSLVEVMGRGAGFLALYVGISVGATAVLLPDLKDKDGNPVPLDINRDLLDRITEARLVGNTHFMVVVAEGVTKDRKLGEDVKDIYDLADKVKDAFGMKPTVTVLGHLQGGGSPTARDREMASRMGYAAVKAIAEGRPNVIIGTAHGEIVEHPIEEALQMKKTLQMERYEVLEALQNRVPRG